MKKYDLLYIMERYSEYCKNRMAMLKFEGREDVGIKFLLLEIDSFINFLHISSGYKITLVEFPECTDVYCRNIWGITNIEKREIERRGILELIRFYNSPVFFYHEEPYFEIATSHFENSLFRIGYKEFVTKIFRCFPCYILAYK